ncbi:MAG: hypothetical protein ACO1OB_21980 [Archangium sp.]
MSVRFVAVAAALVAVSGCQGIFEGQVDGKSFTVNEAIAIPNACIGEGNCGWIIYLSEKTGLCDALNDNVGFKNEKYLDIVVQGSTIDDDEEFTVPGDGWARFSELDSDCDGSNGGRHVARSGSITIKRDLSSSDEAADGIFDLSFDDGEAKGSFHATVCDVEWDSRPETSSCR